MFFIYIKEIKVTLKEINHCKGECSIAHPCESCQDRYLALLEWAEDDDILDSNVDSSNSAIHTVVDTLLKNGSSGAVDKEARRDSATDNEESRPLSTHNEPGSED